MSTITVSKLKKICLGLSVPFVFVIFVLCIAPINQNFEFNSDEGINLIKVLLYSEGFSLYTEIWSDQPPLFTSLLASWFTLFGQSILAARLLTLLFSALLVWSFYQALRINSGSLLACIGTLLLVTSRNFIFFSVSVMIGIPSLSLAMFSVYTLTLYKQKTHKYLLFISGLSLALSLQTKFFTVFLIPIMLFYLLDCRIVKHQEQKAKDKRWFSAISWLFAALFFYILIGLLFNSFQYDQLIQAHLQESVAAAFEDYSSFDKLYSMVSYDYDIFGLALFGSFIVFTQKRWEGLFPLVWLVTATTLLLNHQPVWSHHYTLVSIPLAWLAAYGATRAITFFEKKDWLVNFKQFNLKKQFFIGLVILFFVVSVVNFSFKINDVIETMHRRDSYQDINVINLLLRHRDSTQWVFTDRPIYAFYADLLIPPEVAVFSKKRLQSGNLDYDDLFLILQKYQPEQIVISRFKQDIQNNQKLSTYFDKNYSKIYETDRVVFYVLKQIQ